MTEPAPAADISSYKFERIREGRPDPEPALDVEMTRENPIIGVPKFPVDISDLRLVPIYDDPPPRVKPRRARHGPWFRAIVILEIMVGSLCTGVLVAVLIWG